MRKGSFTKPVPKRGKRTSKTEDSAIPVSPPSKASLTSQNLKTASEVCRQLEAGSGWQSIEQHFWEGAVFIGSNPLVKHIKTVQAYAAWKQELKATSTYTSSLRSTTSSECDVTICCICMLQKNSSDFVYTFTFEEDAIRSLYLVWDTSGIPNSVARPDGKANGESTVPSQTPEGRSDQQCNSHTKPLQKKKSISSMRLIKKPGHEIQNDSNDTIPKLFQSKLTKRAIDRVLTTMHEEGNKLHVSSITNMLLYREVLLASGSLIGLGLTPKKNALFLSMDQSSSQRIIIAGLGVMFIGGIVIPLNPESPGSSVTEIISDCQCPVIFTDSLDYFKNDCFTNSASFQQYVRAIILLNDPLTDTQTDTTILNGKIQVKTWNSFKEIGVEEDITKAVVDNRTSEVSNNMPCLTVYEHPLISVENKGVYTHSGLAFSSALVACSATIRSASPRNILSLVGFHNYGGWLPVISVLTTVEECELFLTDKSTTEILLRANPRILWITSPRQLLQLENSIGNMIINLNIEYILTVTGDLRDTLTARNYHYFRDEPGIPISMHFGNIQTGYVGMVLKLGSDGSYSLETCDGAEERGTPPEISHMGVSVFKSEPGAGKRWVATPLVRDHKNLLGGLDEIHLKSGDVVYPLERLFEILKYMGSGINSCYLFGEDQTSLVLLISMKLTSFGNLSNRVVDPAASTIHDAITSDKWTSHIEDSIAKYNADSAGDGELPISGWAILPEEVSEGLSQSDLLNLYPEFIKSAYGDSFNE